MKTSAHVFAPPSQQRKRRGRHKAAEGSEPAAHGPTIGDLISTPSFPHQRRPAGPLPAQEEQGMFRMHMCAGARRQMFYQAVSEPLISITESPVMLQAISHERQVRERF